jgi:hypothetical protein
MSSKIVKRAPGQRPVLQPARPHKLRRREDQHPPNRDKESEFPELRKGARILSPFAILHIQPRRGRFAISWIFHAEIGHVFSFQEKG